MTRTESELKGLVGKAAEVKQGHPTLSNPAARQVAKFTNQEAEDHTLQQRVRHMVSPPTKYIIGYLLWWYLIIDEYGCQSGLLKLMNMVDSWRGGIVGDVGHSTINQMELRCGCLLVCSGNQQWFYFAVDKFLFMACIVKFDGRSVQFSNKLQDDTRKIKSSLM